MKPHQQAIPIHGERTKNVIYTSSHYSRGKNKKWFCRPYKQ